MESLSEWIDSLKESEKIIIVEGIKDKKALKLFNIDSFAIDKQPLFKFVEFISSISKQVIILTDLDVEGKKLYKKLKTDLQDRGVEIDNKFREFIFKETKLRQIEGFPSYYEKHNH